MKQSLRFLAGLAGVILFFACEQPVDTTKVSGPTNPDPSPDSKPLSAIEIASPPAKTLYKLNETFDATGLVVKGTFSDNTEKNLTASEYTIDTVDTASEGTKTVMIRAESLTTSFEIEVSGKTLTSTTMTSGPTKTAYNLGDNFSVAGIVITRTYSDGSTAKVSNSAISVNGYDKTKRGTQSISLKVDGNVVSTFDITVTIPSTATIKVNKYKSVYIKGESFDPEGAGIEATVTTSSGSYTLTWENGGITSKDTLTGYTSSALGAQSPNLVLDNASAALDVFYVADVEPEVYFDYGYMRHTGDPHGTKPAGIDSGPGKYYVKAGETLVLAPVRFLIGYGRDHTDKGATYSWSVSGGNYDTAASTSGEYFSLKPTEAEKTYTVTVSVTGNNYVDNSTVTKTASTEVVCYTGTVDAGGKTFPRAAPPSSPYDPSPAPQNTLKNFAPGQFAEQGNGLGWSLGAWGGYQIWTVKHQAEYDIRGNGMGGWEEPGIVWVMEDNNGNGLPDEMWYELKGGDDSNGKQNLITRRYGLTYFSPDSSGSGRKDRRIYWLDSKGRGGMMFGGFSAKWGVTGDWVTFTGTILRDDGNIGSGANPSILGSFSDYVDIAYNPKFNISNARRADGSSITLNNVKFIKVQSGMFRYGDSTLGDVSTEVHSADGLGTDGAKGPNTTFPLP